MQDDSSYWATVAQIVPVLSIGVMLEYRFLLRRIATGDGEYASSRGQRLILAASLLVAIGGLATAFLVAVDGLRTRAPADTGWGYLAEMAVVSSASIALVVPGILLAFASVQDVLIAVHRLMPWSAVARARKEYTLLLEENVALRRETRNLRVSSLIRITRAYVAVSAMELAARHRTPTQSARLQAQVAKMYEDVDLAYARLKDIVKTTPREREKKEFPNVTEDENRQFRSLLSEMANRTST